MAGKIPRKFEYTSVDWELRGKLIEHLEEMGVLLNFNRHQSKAEAAIIDSLGVYSTRHPRQGEKSSKKFTITVRTSRCKDGNRHFAERTMAFSRRLFTIERFLERTTEAILREMPFLIMENL